MSSFLHSPAWERFQKSVGNTVVRQDGQLFVHKQVSFVGYWLISRCGIGNSFVIPTSSEKSYFLRVEPIDDAALNGLTAFAAKHRLNLVQTVAVQPRQTVLLDLRQPWEDILAGMKQKHRYNLKQTEKHDLETEIVSGDVLSAFPRFWKLLSDTSNRQDFRTHSRSYYEKMVEELQKDDMIHLVFVKKDDVDLAAMTLITHDGTATYLHGASSEDKGYRAPFLLHAAAIKFSQSRSLQTYDFWGTDLEQNAEGEWIPKEGHASAGTSRFKIGFGGSVLNYPGTYDLILNPFCYTLYKLLRQLRGGKRAFS